MKVARINAYEFGSNCWLVFDEKSGEGVIIDPSPEIDKITETLENRKVTLKYIFLTHGHFDHMTSVDTLRAATGAPLCVHKDDAECLVNSNLNAYRKFMAADLVFRPADILLSEGDALSFGDLEVTLMHTPGHSEGSVCYFIGDAMFSGDTLFDGGIGRSDLVGSDTRKLIDSLKRIALIEGDYTLYCGHGSVSTLNKQKQYNVYLKNINL